ncbi:MAG: metal ABC transporter permease [Corynebacterium sp.]|nr:metal ABC transporter permease [Corynebacterium sp.]
MSQMITSWWETTTSLLAVDFVQNALLAALLFGVIAGALAPIIVMRSMSFAVHATGELSLMGAAFALFIGASVGWGALLGAVLAAMVLSLLGKKYQDASVGIVLSFGMGLSVLFLYLYPGRSTAAFSLLTGQLVGVTSASLKMLIVICIAVSSIMLVFWRPLLFATVDPLLARVGGVPTKWLDLIFAILIGIVASQGVQIIGALLLMALLITPGAAAIQLTSNPAAMVAISTVIAVSCASLGLILSLAPGLPVSVFITSLSFGCYLVCRFIGWRRNRLMRS